jgi:hypothetical protein
MLFHTRALTGVNLRLKINCHMISKRPILLYHVQQPRINHAPLVIIIISMYELRAGSTF